MKLTGTVLVCDLLMFNLVCLFCGGIGLWPFGENENVVLLDLLIANVSYVMVLIKQKISLHRRMSKPFVVLRNVAVTSLFFILVYNALLGMSHMRVPGFFRSALMALLIFLFISIERLIVRKMLANMRMRGRNSSSVLIVGYGSTTKRMIRYFKQAWNGYFLKGLFSDERIDPEESGTAYLGNTTQLLDYLEKNSIDELYISLGNEDDKRMASVVKYCERNMVKVFYIPQPHSINRRYTTPVEFGGTYVMALYNEPLARIGNRFFKRVFDVVFSGLFLCTLYPVIWIVVAIITKIKMPGPVYFKQVRTGFSGEDFVCYKFRSMKVNGDADKKQATRDDPRITKWGAFLRHSSIDELPQFINVFKGDMSVVGPRPHMLAHTEFYSECIPDYMIRHYVKPGVTGWAQVNGERGETKRIEDMERRIDRDIWYIEHWSFWLDVHIIIKTVLNAIRGEEQAF